MPLPDGFLNELKEKNDIESVVSGYVNLRRRGRNLVGLCPFHGEKTPSFVLYPETNSYYCFGCQAAGDPITFIRNIEHLDYMEAVRFLANRVGMTVPENVQDDRQAKLRAAIQEINREAARFFYQMLYQPEGKAGLEYFHRRGLTDGIIRRFGLGYAPDSWNALLKHLTQKGYSHEQLQMADVAIAGRNGGSYDKFRNRVIFPIIDLRGSVIGFGGRVLDDSKPKYLNTSDTLLYKKTMNLYAMNFAKNQTDGYLILAEGYMDVIAMHQAGFKNAVAALGTALTAEQARLMARYVHEIIIAGDNDEAGRKAVNRDIGILRDAGLNVRLLTIPQGKDPDEFIRTNGADRFRLLIEASGNDVEYRLAQCRDGLMLDTPEGKYEYARRAAKVLAGLQDSIERELYAAKLAQELSVPKESVLQQVRPLLRSRNSAQQKAAFREIQKDVSGYGDRVNPQRAQFPRAARAEEAILSILLTHPDYLEAVRKRISAESFMTDFNRRVFLAVSGCLAGGLTDPSLILAEIGADFSSDEIGAVSAMLARRQNLINRPRSEQTDSLLELNDSMETLLLEKEKLNTADISAMTPEQLREYTEKLAALKKKGTITDGRR